MRCDLCPLSDPEDTCPEAEGKFGIEHKDGMLGCKHPKSWVEKRDEEYSKHMVGLDYERPYHRHGKAFYRAYRNYYGDVPEGNRLLDLLRISYFRRYRQCD